MINETIEEERDISEVFINEANGQPISPAVVGVMVDVGVSDGVAKSYGDGVYRAVVKERAKRASVIRADI